MVGDRGRKMAGWVDCWLAFSGVRWFEIPRVVGVVLVGVIWFVCAACALDDSADLSYPSRLYVSCSLQVRYTSP